MSANPTLKPTGQTPFYVAGGSLQRDAPSYVPRQADQELLEGLRDGQLCYILTSRQMGKSSLMIRAATQLREQGVSVVVLDLTAIGQNLTPEQWYDGLLSHIGRQLDLEDALEAFWTAQARLSPLQRFTQALRDVVLARVPGQIVLFIDEIDAVRSLPFSTDEFFAAIRECYNRRAEDPEMHRLTFGLFGVASPSDLIRDTRTTPFNIGRRIELQDFTAQEAAPLAQGLNHRAKGGRGEKLLERILHWTGGHPYLTQRLCQAVASSADVAGAREMTVAGVDRVCEELFLLSRARERDDNLLFVRERMLRSEADLASLLDLYQQVWKCRPVRDDDAEPLVDILRLSGIVRAVSGRLVIRNRIYARVFDLEWVRVNSPDAELRRQRAAFRQGLTRAGVSLGIASAVLSWGLAGLAVKQAQRADRQTHLLRKASQRADENALLANERAEEARQAYSRAERLAAERKDALSQMEQERDRVAQAERSERTLRVQAETLRRESERNAKLALLARNQAETVAQREREARAKVQELVSKLQPLSLTDLGNVAQARGDYALAEGYFRQALKIRQKQDKASLHVAASLTNLGTLAFLRDDLDAAEDDYAHALSIREKRAPDSLHVAASLSNLGAVSVRRDDLLKAKEYHKRALEIRERLAPESLETADSLVSLGSIAQTLNDRPTAQNCYARAVEIREKLAPKSLELANSLNILSGYAANRGDYAAAQEYQTRALNIRKRLSPTSLDVAASLATLGSLAISRGDLVSAQSYYENALAIRQKLAPNSPSVAVTLTILGDIQRDRQKLTLAKDNYARALAINEALDNKAEQQRVRQKLQALEIASPPTK